MSQGKKSYWVVMKAHNWGSLQFAWNIVVKPPPEGPQRFLPVFDTKAQALKYADKGEHIIEIEEL